jgi:hypothetical protein
VSRTAETSNTVGRAASISRFINFFATSACICLLLDGYRARSVEQLLHYICNQVIMQNETAVKLLVCYITRWAFTVLRSATGAALCKSDTSDRLYRLKLLKVDFFSLKFRR